MVAERERDGKQITRAKYCTRKAVFLYPTAELSYLFLRVGFYPTLSYLILLYPTLSYFFDHAMIFLGGRFLKRLLHAKALLRGELSAQQTEGFQTPPHADSKQNGITPCEATLPPNPYRTKAVQNTARLASGTREGRRTNRPCKILHGKAVLLYPTAELSYRIFLG